MILSCFVLECLIEVVLVLLWGCCINYVWTYEVLLWYNLARDRDYMVLKCKFFLNLLKILN